LIPQSLYLDKKRDLKRMGYRILYSEGVGNSDGFGFRLGLGLGFRFAAMYYCSKKALISIFTIHPSYEASYMQEYASFPPMFPFVSSIPLLHA
jgi:hypothetical protein